MEFDLFLLIFAWGVKIYELNETRDEPCDCVVHLTTSGIFNSSVSEKEVAWNLWMKLKLKQTEEKFYSRIAELEWASLAPLLDKY